MNSTLFRAAAVALLMLAVLMFMLPPGTAPIGAQPAQAKGAAGEKYYLVDVKINRTNITGIGVTNTKAKEPEQVFKGNPGTYTFKILRPKFTLDGSLEVICPPVLESGQTANVSFLAVGAWNLNEADGRLQIQRFGYFMPPDQQDENLVNAPPGPNILKMNRPSQLKFDPSNANPTTKNGVITISFDLGARYNTQQHGDTVEVDVSYTYSTDPKLAGSSGVGSTPGPTAGGCPSTFAGDWGDWGPTVGAHRGTPPAGTEGTWGTWTFQQNGNNVTGTVGKIGGKFGPATITGTVSGKTLTGTWKTPNASGKITLTRSGDDCSFAGSYGVDAPPGEPSGNLGPPVGGATPGPTRQVSAHAGNPWETPEGQNCFEKWIALATQKLNAYDGGAEFNGRKPWGFNKYGLMVGGTPAGPMSVAAPDDFPQHGNNKYWWMWDYYNTDSRGQFINDPTLNKAGVPPLHDFVRQCSPTSTPPLPEGMILQAPDLIVPKGARVLVPVQLINAKDVLGMDFELAYLPDIAAAQAEAEKGSVVTGIWEYKLNQPGLLKFNFAQPAPFAGQGTVGGFRFDALGPGRSRTPLTLSVHRVDGPNGAKLPITVINGSITIYDPTDLTDPNNPKNPNPPGGTGTTQPQPTCSGSGRQTINDAQCCLKKWVGLLPTGPGDIMDLNNDGVVDSADALIIIQNLQRDLPK